jgi:hypothetical protein
MEQTRKAQNFCLETLKGKGHLEKLGVEGTIILSGLYKLPVSLEATSKN